MTNNLILYKKLKVEFTKKSIINGLIIYSLGDTVAALILQQFSLTRLVGISLVGAFVYSFEIPNYFRWINKKTSSENSELKSVKKSLFRTALALLYFNPIWIARHLLFIQLFSGNFAAINLSLLFIASKSFLINIPLSLTANYFIQNVLSYKYRFAASAIFSSLMAIYYAMSAVWFK